MRINIGKFGVISKATVNISKELLVFTGQNNTGKTYLTTLLYSLYDLKEIDSSIFNISTKTIELDYSDEDTMYKRDFDLSNEYLSFFSAIAKTLKESLPNIFATTDSAFQNTEIHFNDLDDIRFRVYNKSYSYNEGALSIYKKEKSHKIHVQSADETIPENLLLKTYYDLFFSENTVQVFTDERSAITIFTKELSLNRIKFLTQLVKKSLRTKELLEVAEDRINRYALPIRDGLEVTERYDVLQKKQSDYKHIADDLEHLFLNGKVTVSQNGDLQFQPENSNSKLEIHTTSSTVKSLSPLVFYLRHQAVKNDVIIIDEPELNLHPDNQRRFARFIGRLINEGFKIIISTHSDYIVRELNNLIMLSSGIQNKQNETKLLLKEFNYNENELIAADKVGVYLFRVGKDVEEVTVDDKGFSVATIDEEARELNQISQNIYFTLFD